MNSASPKDPVAGTAGMLLDMKPAVFYLAAFHHESPGAVLWWRPDERGYTPDLEQAGVYTYRQAARLNHGDVAIPVPAAMVDGLRVRRIVDPGDSTNMMFHSARVLRAHLSATGRWIDPLPTTAPDHRQTLIQLLRELHRDEILSEQQCARRLDVDLVTWRGIANGAVS